MITLVESQDKYDLKIDNQSFFKYYKPFKNSSNYTKDNSSTTFQTIKEKPKMDQPKPPQIKKKTAEDDIGDLTSGFAKFDIPRKNEAPKESNQDHKSQTSATYVPAQVNQTKINKSQAQNIPPSKNQWVNSSEFEFSNQNVEKISKDLPSKPQKAQKIQQKNQIFDDLLDEANTKSGLSNDLFSPNQINPYAEVTKKEKENSIIQKNNEPPQNLIRNEDKSQIKTNVNQEFLDLFMDKEDIKSDQKPNKESQKKDWQEEIFSKINEKMPKEEGKKANTKVPLNELQKETKISETKNPFNTLSPGNPPIYNMNQYPMGLN